MSVAAPEQLTVAELARRVREVEPAALLVPGRFLRRIIKHDGKVSGLGLKVPHRKSWVIDSRQFMRLVDRDELGVEAWLDLPPTIILLPRPEDDEVDERTLVKYWQLLFHARVHVALGALLQSGELDAADIDARIERLGRTEFDEIRAVLKQEEFLFESSDAAAIYVEFAAVYLELAYFAPGLLRWYFPGLTDTDRALAILADDLDGPALLAATRLAGAPDPAVAVAEPLPEDLEDEPPPGEPPPDELGSPRDYDRLVRRAQRASAVGNQVKAAILRAKAARLAGPRAGHAPQIGAQQELDRLTRRLAKALALPDGQQQEWTAALVPLVERSAGRFWTRAGRLLYDLQKVCVDHEREIFTVDLVEWALSWFRIPIKRSLPGQREVLMTKHLRAAFRRLAAIRLEDDQRQALSSLFEHAIEQTETQLRDRFRRPIQTSLDEVGLVPANIPETVARRKLVEELLDRIVERDFLTMFDLRDAVSRNNLKLPDVSDFKEFFVGDRVLRADRRLAVSMDGVYRRGEIYLRWPQRLSTVAFGTPLGRLLVRWVALPYGGAFLTIEFIRHLYALVMHWTVGTEVEVEGPAWLWTASVGTVVLALLHAPMFRRVCVSAIKNVFRGARLLLVELPRRLLRWPPLRFVLDSPVFQVAKRYLIKPLVFTALVLAVIPQSTARRETTLTSGLLVFLGMNLLFNSRLGRNLEELVTDWVVRSWDKFRIRVLAALVQSVMEFFARIVDTIDRLLYSVDEWLRFKSGQSQLTLAVKSVLGVLWFAVTYVIRLCVNLLIEPQINPVKHFPVVTVTHKIIWPLCLTMVGPLEPVLGKFQANLIAGATGFLLPGVFGFLVWELKENWRLFKANRPPVLKPVMVGDHGEQVLGFLKPGFRSGRLPKLFARLRRADRKALRTGRWKAALKNRESLNHVETALRRFIERELIALLNESRAWRGLPLTVSRMKLATNSIRLDLAVTGLSGTDLRLAFEDRAGSLVVGVVQAGWLAQLTSDRRQALAEALVGVYKMAGVEIVLQQVDAALAPGIWRHDITEQGLMVWPPQGTLQPSTSAVYPLLGDGPLAPRIGESFPALPPKDLDRKQTIFAATDVPWTSWVATWDDESSGGEGPMDVRTLASSVLPHER